MKLRPLLAAAGLVAAAAALAFVCGDVRADDSSKTLKELQQLLESLTDAKDPGERKALVRKLATMTGVRAAERLRKVVRTDPDPSVRVEAATALGKSVAPEALDFLLELVLEGGVHEVRQAIGRAIAKRGGREQLLALFEKTAKTEDVLGRGLILEALAEDPALAAGAALEKFASSSDAYTRCEAMRALARHPAGRILVPDVLRRVLAKHHDLDTIMSGLDVAESLADADFRPIADLLASFLEPQVQSAVDRVKRRLTWIDAVEAAKKRHKDDGYAQETDPLPEPPTPGPRVDIVYIFDASGSVSGYLDMIKERVRREANTLARVGTDLRVGVVAYRDATGRRESWPIRVLPLTYDIAKAEEFLTAVQNRGCGSGAAIADALDQSMDRMIWRWGGLRQVGLISDSKTGDVERCREVVRLHYQTDRTRLHIWYLYRTRTQLPADVEQLARIGGGVVESLE